MGKTSKIDRLIKLTQTGWRAYEGQATGALYEALNCDKSYRSQARWFAKGDLLVCVGCERACILSGPAGFQLPMFRYPAPPAPEFRLNPDELMARRKLLTVKEAAYVLNVSPRRLREMIYEGRFTKTKAAPTRVPVEQVRAALADLEYWTSAGEEQLDDKAKELGL